jgi:hypothetical protein
MKAPLHRWSCPFTFSLYADRLSRRIQRSKGKRAPLDTWKAPQVDPRSAALLLSSERKPVLRGNKIEASHQ